MIYRRAVAHITGHDGPVIYGKVQDAVVDHISRKGRSSSRIIRIERVVPFGLYIPDMCRMLTGQVQVDDIFVVNGPYPRTRTGTDADFGSRRAYISRECSVGTGKIDVNRAGTCLCGDIPRHFGVFTGKVGSNRGIILRESGRIRIIYDSLHIPLDDCIFSGHSQPNRAALH